MKKLLMILAAMAVIPSAQAADNCLLSKEALVPVMHFDAPGHKVRLNPKERGIIETAKMKGGGTVTYTAKGCSHFFFSYQFTNIPGGVPEKSADPFAFVLGLMDKIPLHDGFDVNALTIPLKEKQAAGKAAFDDNGTTELPCGNASCHLTMGKDSITVDYDDAL